MTNMRRCIIIVCLLLFALPARCEGLISADSGGAPPDETVATLYFRYRDTALLAQERRTLRVSRDESYEKALVEALLAGPASSGGELFSVFPPSARVMSTQAHGDVVYVTFDEGLIAGYPDEPSALNTAYWQREAPLRRHLAMAALTATLTESGEYRAVQVLVHGQTGVETSLRLHASFFLSGEDALLSALPRDESYLMTPSNAARACLTAWLERDWATLLSYVAASEERPSESALEQSDALISLTVSPGSVSPDGRTAVVCADLTLLSKDGAERTELAYPITLIREYGAWKIPYARLSAMMGLE